jgi:hypothetical protein
VVHDLRVALALGVGACLKRGCNRPGRPSGNRKW